MLYFRFCHTCSALTVLGSRLAYQIFHVQQCLSQNSDCLIASPAPSKPLAVESIMICTKGSGTRLHTSLDSNLRFHIYRHAHISTTNMSTRPMMPTVTNMMPDVRNCTCPVHFTYQSSIKPRTSSLPYCPISTGRCC